MMRALSFIRRVTREDDGAATVELALVLPFLTAVLVGILATFPQLMTQNAMHSAVSSGAQYVMSGASNTTLIQSMTTTSWSGRPNDGTVAVNQYCVCAGVSGSCSTLCAGSPPQRFISISAAMTFHGITGDQPLSTQQVVRTR